MAISDRTRNSRYIFDIQAGLVPSDPEFDVVYDAIARNGGTDLSRLTDGQIAAMAAEIRSIRQARAA